MLSMRVWCAMVLAAAVQAAGVAPALRLRGGGKHFKTPSEAASPSVAGCALRLDIPVLRAEVAKAIASARARQGAINSTAGGGGSGSGSSGVLT